MLDADLTPGFVSRQFNHNPNNSAFQVKKTLVMYFFKKILFIQSSFYK